MGHDSEMGKSRRAASYQISEWNGVIEFYINDYTSLPRLWGLQVIV